MKCNNCGNENVTGAFCEVCGTEMVAEPIAEATNEPVIVNEANVVEADAAVDPGKTLGTVSMILGIVGIVLGITCPCAFACLGSIAPFIISVAGVILGILAMSKSKAAGLKNKTALIGVILCAVAIVLTVICNICGSFLGIAVTGIVNGSY